jgi:hypothetical protein
MTQIPPYGSVAVSIASSLVAEAVDTASNAIIESRNLGSRSRTNFSSPNSARLATAFQKIQRDLPQPATINFINGGPAANTTQSASSSHAEFTFGTFEYPNVMTMHLDTTKRPRLGYLATLSEQDFVVVKRVFRIWMLVLFNRLKPYA